MPRRSRADELAERANFVFLGTVLRLQDATLAAVEDRTRTVVVKVDQVFHAPDALAHTAGQEITVLLARGETVATGQQVVFYTNGWLLGESIAVQSVGH